MQPWYRKSDDWWYFYEVKGSCRQATELFKGAGRKRALSQNQLRASVDPMLYVESTCREVLYG